METLQHSVPGCLKKLIIPENPPVIKVYGRGKLAEQCSRRLKNPSLFKSLNKQEIRDKEDNAEELRNFESPGIAFGIIQSTCRQRITTTKKTTTAHKSLFSV